MVKLEIQLDNGSIITTHVDSYNALEMEAIINNREKMSVAIGDAVFSKLSIRVVRPIEVE